MVRLIRETMEQTKTLIFVLCVGFILMLGCSIVADGLQAQAPPLVERIQKEDGNHLGVHVPLFYDMNLDRKNTTGESSMNINVLGGLVRIFKDRVKGPDGSFAGPLQVSIFGTPVYDNTRNPLATTNRINGEPVENNEISSGASANLNQQQLRPVTGGSNALPIVGDILSRIGQMLQSLQRPIQQQQAAQLTPQQQNSAFNPKNLIPTGLTGPTGPTGPSGPSDSVPSQSRVAGF